MEEADEAGQKILHKREAERVRKATGQPLDYDAWEAFKKAEEAQDAAALTVAIIELGEPTFLAEKMAKAVIKNQKAAITKQGGAPTAEGAVPHYTTASDPQFKDLPRPKKEDSMGISIKEKRDKKRKPQEMSKAELETAVIAKSERLAARNGTSARLEEARLWEKIYPQQPQRDSEGQVLKYETPKVGTTQAEKTLHSLAVEVAKREGLSYSQGYNEALKRKPELYAQYIREINAGETFEAPEPAEYRISGFLSRGEEAAIAKARRAKRNDPGTTMNGDLDTDGDEEEDDDPMDDDDSPDERLKRGRTRKADLSAPRCTSCGSTNSAENNYCAHCGSRMETE
jgi:hypothetical protein